MKLLLVGDLCDRGYRKSHAQRNRDIAAGRFPAPAAYIGRTPAWTEQQWKTYVDGLIAKQAEKSTA